MHLRFSSHWSTTTGPVVLVYDLFNDPPYTNPAVSVWVTSCLSVTSKRGVHMLSSIALTNVDLRAQICLFHYVETTTSRLVCIFLCGPVSQQDSGSFFCSLRSVGVSDLIVIDLSVMVETDKKSWTRKRLTSIFDNPYNDMPFLSGTTPSFYHPIFRPDS